MKEGTGGRKEKGGDKSATRRGKICPRSGVTGINRGAAEYGRDYY